MNNFCLACAKKYHSLQPYADASTLNHTQFWLGIDRYTQQKVMIKQLLTGYTPVQFSHFYQEYQVYRQLNDLLEQEKRYFLAMVDGHIGRNTADNYLVFKWEQGSMLKSLMTGNALPFFQKIDYLIQLCNAVEILHSQGIIHCDIKPSNVLICQNQMKILDFGLSQIIGKTKPCNTLTAGTPAYMSPEQFVGQAVVEASDYYSIGVVMYELLQGNKPFYASTLTDWTIAHCQLPVPALQAVCPENSFISADLERLTGLAQWLMAKLPENRPPSLQPVIDQLSNYGV